MKMITGHRRQPDSRHIRKTTHRRRRGKEAIKKKHEKDKIKGKGKGKKTGRHRKIVASKRTPKEMKTKEKEEFVS